jgi:GT2 family glycosyltransferase
MIFNVVILSRVAANLIPCVQSILACEPELPPERIVVVDDGARAEAEAYLPGVHWVSGAQPFIFARNANLGIVASGSDFILLNDDARLLTPRGFTMLSEQVHARPRIGACSAGIQGLVGNPRQVATGRMELRLEDRGLAFVCVYIPKAVYDVIGPLDPRFVGYGFEDNDYCTRLLKAGFQLAIWDGCVVDHSGQLPSTFRTRANLADLFEQNRRLFQQKWETQHMTSAPVDLLYLACNRLEFTKETFTALVANTDWNLINELFVIDDGSTDGTREWLRTNLPRVPARTRFLATAFGSPVTAMVHFIRLAQAPVLAKTDNDAMLPPGWLRQSLDVLDRHPDLMLLGIEAMYPHSDDPALPRSYTPAVFISGLGLYRRAAFGNSVPTAYDKWFGLEEWQSVHAQGLKRGWITPALPVFLLDRIPFDPYRSWSASYVQRGWQREWPKYDPTCALWKWRWADDEAQPPPVVLPAGDARFMCAMRVKNEARYIRESLTQTLRLCQTALVFDDHSSDDTMAICRTFGTRVKLLPSPFEGLDEARDKNYVLAEIAKYSPEWVLWIDGDEVLERSGPERLKQVVTAVRGVAAFNLRIAYLWNDPQHMRIDGIFGRFRRPSLFRLLGQAFERLHFRSSGCGGNFHCGNVPDGLVGNMPELPVRLKHYGYMTKEQRMAKYTFYTTTDPQNHAEDNYRHLAEIRGAQFAPGPPQIVPWIE